MHVMCNQWENSMLPPSSFSLSLTHSRSLRLHTTTVFKEPFPLKAVLAEEEQEEEAEEKSARRANP